MDLRIEIENQQKRIPIKSLLIRKIVRKILIRERIKKAHLSVVLVTDRKIKALNKKFLNHNWSTDVLAFNLGDISSRGHAFQILEGEIILSTERAIQNAKRFKTSAHKEVLLYIIHGILHLLGYDDHALEGIRQMQKKEVELMNSLERLLRDSLKIDKKKMKEC